MNGFKLMTLTCCVRVSWIASVIPKGFHPTSIISFPLQEEKLLYAFFITSAWRGFSVDECMSTVVVVTSQVGLFFSSFNIEEQKYSLKAFFSNFFKLLFVWDLVAVANGSCSLVPWLFRSNSLQGCLQLL